MSWLPLCSEHSPAEPRGQTVSHCTHLTQVPGKETQASWHLKALRTEQCTGKHKSAASSSLLVLLFGIITYFYFLLLIIHSKLTAGGFDKIHWFSRRWSSGAEGETFCLTWGLDKGFLLGRMPFHEDSCPGGDGKVRLTGKVGSCDFSCSPSKISQLDGCWDSLRGPMKTGVANRWLWPQLSINRRELVKC